MHNFLEQVIKYRKDNLKVNKEQVKDMLPGGLKSAFSYVNSLKFKEKPDYNLIKLYLAQNLDDEKLAFETELMLKNCAIGRDLLYDQEPNITNQPAKKISNYKVVDDMDSDYEFDLECDELLHLGNSVEATIKNVNQEKSKR